MSYGSPTESGEAWITSTNLAHRPSALSAACSQTSSKAPDLPVPPPGTPGAPARSYPAAPSGPAPIQVTATLGCQPLTLTLDINRLHNLIEHGSPDSLLDSVIVLFSVIRSLTLPCGILSLCKILILPATCDGAPRGGRLFSVENGINVTGRETIYPCGLRQHCRRCSLSFQCMLLPTSGWFVGILSSHDCPLQKAAYSIIMIIITVLVNSRSMTATAAVYNSSTLSRRWSWLAFSIVNSHSSSSDSA